MIFRILSLFFLCFTLAFSVLADNPIHLTEIKTSTGHFEAGEKIEVLGSDFGTDKDKIKINIAGKDYPIDATYGNQLFFIPPKDIRSGTVFLKKTKTGSSVAEESNKQDIDFKEPIITKFSFPQGMAPNLPFILTGNNLKDAQVFCDKTEIKVKESLPNQLQGEIPNIVLQCTLSVVSHGFVFDTTQKIQSLPSLKITSAEVKSDEVLIHADNFDPFQNSMNLFSLSFSSGESLSNAEYKDSTTIRFKKTIALPLVSNIQVKIGETVLPEISYSASGTVPNIIDMSEPIMGNDGKVSFEVSFDSLFTDSVGTTNTASVKVYLNNSEIKGEKIGQRLKMTQTSFPAEKGSLYAEKGGLKSMPYVYSFPRNLVPSIQKVRAVTALNASGGTLEIIGTNFEPKTSVRVTSSVGKIDIREISSYLIRVSLPHQSKNGDYTITVSNASGSSPATPFTVPSEVEKSFYPLLKITSLEYPMGPFLGKLLRIHGEGFSSGITSINFDDASFVPEILSPRLLEVKIPKTVALTGKLSLSLRYKTKTDPFSYELFPSPKEEKLIFSFPDEQKTSLQIKPDFQDIFSFAVMNTKQTVESGDISFAVKGDLSIVSGLPFTAYQLVDADAKPIPDIKIHYDSEKSVLKISGLKIPVKTESQHFTLQGKLFINIPQNTTRSIDFSALQMQDENKETITSDWKSPATSLEITLPASQGGNSVCKEWMQTAWKDCDKLRARPSQPISALESQEKPLENPKITEAFSFIDAKESDWFYPFMKDLFEKGIIKGLADKTLQPAGHVNRAELLSFVIRAKGEKVPTYATIHFDDIGNHWAKDTIEYALEKGYIKPNTSFFPAKEITRGEAVRMLCKSFPDTFSAVQPQAFAFTDVPNEALKTCLMTAVPLKIVQGTSTTTFSPDAFVTRAEFAKMLDTLLKSQ